MARTPTTVVTISIHALLTESDITEGSICFDSSISIHALLAESDADVLQSALENHGFLSTLSLRRATSRAAVPAIFPSDFYPRSPCGERLRICRSIPPRRKISIHALLAESDVSERELQPQTWNFYPRSPCGERPCDNSTGFAYIEISIHALLAESDLFALQSSAK